MVLRVDGGEVVHDDRGAEGALGGGGGAGRHRADGAHAHADGVLGVLVVVGVGAGADAELVLAEPPLGGRVERVALHALEHEVVVVEVGGVLEDQGGDGLGVEDVGGGADDLGVEHGAVQIRTVTPASRARATASALRCDTRASGPSSVPSRSMAMASMGGGTGEGR